MTSFKELRGADIMEAAKDNINRDAYEAALQINTDAGYLSNAEEISISEVRRLLPVGQRVAIAWPMRQHMGRATEHKAGELRNVMKQNSAMMLTQRVGESGHTSRMDWAGHKAYRDTVTGWIHIYTPGSYLDVAYLPVNDA